MQKISYVEDDDFARGSRMICTWYLHYFHITQSRCNVKESKLYIFYL